MSELTARRLFSAEGAGSVALLPRRDGLISELTEAARNAKLFPVHVYLGDANSFDIAYFRIANELMADIGLQSPMPIENVQYVAEQLASAELPGERGQALILEEFDGLLVEPSFRLDLFIFVLSSIYHARLHMLAEGTAGAFHSMLIGSPQSLESLGAAFERLNRELTGGPNTDLFPPVPLVRFP